MAGPERTETERARTWLGLGPTVFDASVAAGLGVFAPVIDFTMSGGACASAGTAPRTSRRC